MEDAILNFAKQLSWEPFDSAQGKPIEKEFNKFIVCGMGGSALPAGFLKANDPKLDLLIHRDYGLPRVPDYFLQESLIICSSYSGNTEETISVFQAAIKQGLNVAVVADQGELLDLAKKNSVPYVDLPHTGIQPRMALGYFIRALAKLMNQETVLAETAAISQTLKPEILKPIGETLAGKLKGKIPLIYTSNVFYPVAYAWKINFNETAKVPAFANVLSEANHNEISGFGLTGSTSLPNFRQSFCCLMLTDSQMDERLKRRFVATEALYERQGINTEIVELIGNNTWEKLLTSFLLAGWTSVSLARLYQVNPETNPVIEDFKRRITDGETTMVS